MTRKLAILVGLLALLLSLVVCDIAGTGEDVIEGVQKGGEAVQKALEEAQRVLGPLVKQLAEDGIDFAQYFADYASCKADGNSRSFCEEQARQKGYNDCIKSGKSRDYCSARYQ